MSVNRHLSRTIAMQSLYEWNFHPDSDVLEITHRVMKPVEKDVDIEYLDRVIKGTAKYVDEIDGLIARAAPEWPLDQISVIDKSILRLAGYELLKDRDIPPKVAINEAVEIAKTFGGENSSKFINGVLGTLYRQSDRYTEEDDKPKVETEEPK
ncbi:MAG: N utilization substance protein B-like protein [Berkelbacteria bacterium GW2011_GWA2_46_7]|uniref:Transcription antitermination protein NusB n=1 Tax=Berkelbacteria bacterium GW2011_GWA2_46_7 TaxID=1618335 RepID=A0A0G1TDS9_9BACT|nr:MAG: N utilization substance protein B-like protein [Berkelbacteria bacterium GW2011_GWA2_46_7]